MDRYAPCQTLHEHGVAYTCWFEDAVIHHGVPTALFDLYLLVSDIDAAAQVLLDNGWAPPEGRYKDRFCFHSRKEFKPFRRLAHPTQPDLHTFIMKAADWGFPAALLDAGRLECCDSCSDCVYPHTTPAFFPRLADLMDALIDSILDLDAEYVGGRVSDHLVVMLTYLYEYVPALKKNTFADQLAYEHRQMHYDMKAIYCFSLRFIAHEREVRQQIRDKKLVPHYDPWNNDRECLS